MARLFNPQTICQFSCIEPISSYLAYFTSLLAQMIVKNHSLNLTLIGVVVHSQPSILQLFFRTEEPLSGANHIFGAIRTAILKRLTWGTTPRKLFIQVDNCMRVIKNNYFLTYQEHLVASEVLKSVEVGLLPIGDTQKGMHKIFTWISAWLRHNIVITLTDLHNQICRVHLPNPNVQHMKQLINWFSLFDQYQYIKPIHIVSQIHISSSVGWSDNKDNEGKLMKSCHVDMT